MWNVRVGMKRKTKTGIVLPCTASSLIASPLLSGRKYFEREQGPPLISCLQTETPTAEQHRQDEKWEEGGFSEYPGATTGIYSTVQISAL